MQKRLDPTALERLKAAFGRQAAKMLPGLILSFFEHAETLLADARAALDDDDAEELGRLAHTFKSNSATFGAMLLADMCHRLELHAKQGETEGAGELLAAIDREYATVKAALENVLEQESAQTGKPVRTLP